MVIFGLSEASSLTTWNAIIADQTTPQNRNEAFTLSFIVSIAGMGVGSAVPLAFPLLTSWLAIDSVAIHVDFVIIFTVLALLTPVTLSALLRGYRREVTKSEPSRSGSNRTLFKFSAINSLLGFGSGLIVPLILTWFYLRFGVPDTYTGPIYTLAAFSIAASAVASPVLARKLGLVRAIVAAEGVSTVFLASLAFVSDPIIATTVFIMRSVLINSATPLADSYLMGIVRTEERGAASAINSIIWRLPNNLSTVIGGVLLQEGFLGLPFILAGAIQAVAVALFYAVFRDLKPAT
jgi:MFS family permease